MADELNMCLDNNSIDLGRGEGNGGRRRRSCGDQADTKFFDRDCSESTLFESSLRLAWNPLRSRHHGSQRNPAEDSKGLAAPINHPRL